MATRSQDQKISVAGTSREIRRVQVSLFIDPIDAGSADMVEIFINGRKIKEVPVGSRMDNLLQLTNKQIPADPW